MKLGAVARCAICQRATPLQNATVGRLLAFGGSAIVCELHSLDNRHAVESWMAFELQQQYLLAQAEQGKEDSHHERSLS
ncbi:hypothetical protein FRAHR75_320082 [Frankia sp. Hr75.2]|nr:hypothetical protein FRAHR75_320082 [Frankia sp. Hr75.2]